MCHRPARCLPYATFRKPILSEIATDVHGFGCGSPPGARIALQQRGQLGEQLIESREGGTRKRRAGFEDVEIGRKIRALRLQRGLSQTSLAEGIGLTFQQVQKYEKGTNRVSAGRLQKIADMLDTPVTFFYGGMGTAGKKREKQNDGLAYLQTKARCG